MIHTLIPHINAINQKGSFGSISTRLLIYSDLAGTKVEMRLRRPKGDFDEHKKTNMKPTLQKNERVSYRADLHV